MASGDLMNNRYEVVRKLGEGGEAEVFLVIDRNEHNLQ
jgi:serine/threonine protein kinase